LLLGVHPAADHVVLTRRGSTAMKRSMGIEEGWLFMLHSLGLKRPGTDWRATVFNYRYGFVSFTTETSPDESVRRGAK
jgi:hypothetical protein